MTLFMISRTIIVCCTSELKFVRIYAQFIPTVYSYASKYPSNPLKVPSYPEFENLFLVELRRRQTQAKQDRKRLVSEIVRNSPKFWMCPVCGSSK